MTTSEQNLPFECVLSDEECKSLETGILYSDIAKNINHLKYIIYGIL
jgi:hypothetical protein